MAKLIGSIVLAALGLTTEAPPESDFVGLTARIHPDSVQVVMDQPIQIDLIINNNTGNEAKVYFASIDGQDFRVTIEPEGKPRIKGQMDGPPKEFLVGSWAHLAPKEQLERSLVLDEWYSFSDPGGYKVTLEVPVTGVRSSYRSKLIAKVAVHVGPTDLEALSCVCEELAAKAVSRSSSKARDAAQALAQVDAEVCLPSFHLMLKEGYSFIKKYAIKGLARIEATAAIDTLVESWERLDKESQAEALKEFDKRGRREELVRAIEAAGLAIELGRGPWGS